MRALIALLILLFASPAMAAEKKPEKGDKAPEPPFVDISLVGLPIVADGVLVNYVFVALRVTLTAKADIGKLRQKEPYLRDALVRTAYRQPFVRPDSYIQIDQAALISRMTAEANRILGPGQVVSVKLKGEPHPKRTAGLPTPHGAAPAERAPIP